MPVSTALTQDAFATSRHAAVTTADPHRQHTNQSKRPWSGDYHIAGHHHRHHIHGALPQTDPEMAMDQVVEGRRLLARSSDGKHSSTCRWSRLPRAEKIQAVEIANVGAVARGVTVGLGRKRELLEDHQISQAKQALIASFALMFLIEGLSATSYICLLRSMNPSWTYHRTMDCICGIVVAWSIAGLARFSASASEAVPEPSVSMSKNGRGAETDIS